MNNNKIRVYCASGWFSDNTRAILDKLEELLRGHSRVSEYLPRKDGVKLTPNELHDHELRKKVFLDNVCNIDASDYVLANLDGADGYYDTGTMWEVGYAMSKGIPVLAFDTTDTLSERFASIKSGFSAVFKDYSEISEFFSTIVIPTKDTNLENQNKVLFIGPDNTEENMENNKDIVALLLESHGRNIRWLDDLSNSNIYDNLDYLFADVSYIISVIDDRHPIVSWIMGQAYERDIPVVTYTNYDYGVNIMLLCSLLSHVKGKDELKSLVQKIRREGIESLSEYDSTGIKAM